MILRLWFRLTADVSSFGFRTHLLQSSRRCLTSSSNSWASNTSSKAVVEYDLPPRSQTAEGQIVLDKALKIIEKWVGADLRITAVSFLPPSYHHLPAPAVTASCVA